LTKYITNYYKNLFGKPEGSNMSLSESMVDDIPQVTHMENEHWWRISLKRRFGRLSFR
jgi:hypothetical protein